jgi:hypothetical protein
MPEKEPMIKLQPGGVAPIISYNVPEGTTYSGRNFIDLQFAESFFKPTQPQAQAQAQASISASQPAYDKAQLEELGIAREEVELMQSQGKELVLYETLAGKKAYRYIDAPSTGGEPYVATTTARELEYDSFAGEAPIVSMRPIEDPDPDPEPIPTEIAVDIASPAAGSTVNGPYTGASMNISGTASVLSGGGSIRKVEVQVGSGAYQTAALSGGTWTLANVVVSTPGALKLSARATHSDGTTAFRQISVTIAIAPQPDTTVPVVTIVSPTPGQLLPGASNPITFKVEGTASDNKLLAKVELIVDGLAPVQVDTGNGWANWSKTISLSPGAHTLIARATDGNNNVGQHSQSLHVDTVVPRITITSPLANAEFTGTELHGAMVEVRGTSQDENGIRKVELSWGANPVWVESQPKSAGDWSEWKGNLLIKVPGLQVIQAKTTDRAGNFTISTVAIKIVVMPEIVSRLKRLIIVEQYQLSSYLGNYGAGRTLKTFSLLPGEKTTISVKSYTQDEVSSKNASSVVDSFTDESAVDLEKSMANEQSDRQGYDESFKYRVSAEAKASWGFGSASINGEVSGGTNGAREEFAKNMSNAVQKHVAKASSNRHLQVNTSYEQKTTTTEESAIVRDIENINVGRTLNFVFRQMNQEFITLLHLTDVRIGYFSIDIVNGKEEPRYREVTLPQLDALLTDTIVPDKRAVVRKAILHQLINVFDYKDRHHSFVEDVVMKDGEGKDVAYSNYLRVKKDYASTYRDDASGTEIRVQGIITAATKHVMRTEGIIVEALLGQGNALDEYSEQLQRETIRTKKLENDLLREREQRENAAQRILAARDQEAADIYAKLYYPPVAAAAAAGETNE